MIVVDTDVLCYAYLRLDPERSELADRVTEKDDEWAMPTVWPHEFWNVLASYVRFHGMPVRTARRLAAAVSDRFRVRTIPVPAREVLNAVAEGNRTAYDAQYIALARRLGITLVTGDRKLAQAFPDCAVTMEAFTS
ncbi:MAG: type II toxin-antitoxin system VapC family toxin [Rhodothermales bacterium]|nr:type II toxin-antitoxin system VapC family toxin [Rhodothermales bacterium]MBO6778702.1 type II toxin-antitoxin system VapC family toxin [Rhodothermales bacterium]